MNDALPKPFEDARSTLITETPVFPAQFSVPLAAAWFAGCGIIAGFPVGLVIMLLSTWSVHVQDGTGGALIGALAAGVSGCLFGRDIFNKQRVPSVDDAAKCGAKVVFATHCLVVLCWVPALFLNSGEPVIFRIATTTAMAFVGLFFSLVLAGIVTFPVGCTGAMILYKLARLQSRPKGCSVHGYGEERNAIAGE